MKLKSGFVIREIAGTSIVVPVGERVKDFNGVINLNDTGVFMWGLLEKDVSEEEMVQAVLGEYDVEKSVAERDVKKFIEKLKEAKLLK